MPTTHGLRAAVRMPAEQLSPAELAQLDLPENVLGALAEFAGGDSGMMVFTGPAGSGKTTSIYALLRQIKINQPGTSIIALEDPVERDLPGVTQIEVSPFGQLTYERALRSILRQDPQVLMLGEIRDAATASLAIQAALSGHRLITTLHAATPGGAIARLLEMGIEPYQVTSSIYAVVSQRLARRKQADGTYRGRVPLAEIVRMDAALRKAIAEGADAGALATVYQKQAGYRGLRDIAEDLIARGITDEAEAGRVIGSGKMK
jgi:type II secretory ATPase GspE/PulE/Tfp pilus assembly ATPase PilB-like protein